MMWTAIPLNRHSRTATPQAPTARHPALLLLVLMVLAATASGAGQPSCPCLANQTQSLNGDGTIDKSEFTTWAGEQAAQVQELEQRLATALTEAQAGTARLDSLEAGATATTEAATVLEATVSALEDGVAELESKQRVDGLEAWIVEIEAKLDATGEQGGASSEETKALAATVESLREKTDATEASVAGMKEELESKERVDALEAWLVEVEQKVDAGAEQTTQQAEEQKAGVEKSLEAVGERLAACEQAQTAMDERVGKTTTTCEGLNDQLEVVAALQEEGASTVEESVGKISLEVEKNRLHISECVKTMGTLKTGIDGVKDRVSAHDKLDARMMNLKQDLEEVMDGNSKKLSDMQSELTLFTSKIERRQGEVDSMTKRIIATSGGNIEKVRLDAS